MVAQCFENDKFWRIMKTLIFCTLESTCVYNVQRMRMRKQIWILRNEKILSWPEPFSAIVLQCYSAPVLLCVSFGHSEFIFGQWSSKHKVINKIAHKFTKNISQKQINGGASCCLCRFSAQQCLGQWFGLKTLSTTRKSLSLARKRIWSPASSASFGIWTHNPRDGSQTL